MSINLNFHPQGRSVNDVIFERQRSWKTGSPKQLAGEQHLWVGYACRLGSMVHFGRDTRPRLRIRDTNKGFVEIWERVSELSGMGIVEWWNGGMDFFSHPFICLFVYQLLFYGLVFSLPAFIFRQSCFVCVFLLQISITLHYKEQSNSKYSVNKNSPETCFIKYSFCVLAIAA